LSDAKRARHRNEAIGFVLQIPRLFAHLSVWENLTAPAWIGGHTADATRGEKLLARVGLSTSRKRAISGLSGGERQRLTVARALINKPSVLLCDEPTGNLDRQTGNELLDLLAELQKEEALTLFVVTHDQEVIARADTRITRADGAVVA
jgi:ABC-type lipoprotein export system ATPase subunit